VPLSVESKVNHQWALDFMHDTLYCGKRFRVLNIIDESTRECLAIEVDTSLPAQRLVRVMEQLKTERGLPNQVRVDNVLPAVLMELMAIRDSSGITRLPSSHSMLG
jgi:putative transposase